MLTKLNAWIDRLFVGHFMSSADTGIYVAGSQVANLFSVITIVFSLIFGAMAARLYFQNQMDRIHALYKVSTKWGLYICLMLFLVVVLFPAEIITISFGADYIEGQIPMTLLITVQLIRVAMGAVGMLLVMTGHQNLWFLLTSFTVIMNVVLNIILIPRYGLIGAATATFISGVFLFPMGLSQVKRLLNMTPYDKRFFKGFIGAIISAAGLYGWSRISPDIPVVALAVAIVLALILFLGSLKILGFDQEDRELLRIVKRRFNRNRLF